jgi:hypothetical protein
MPMSVLVARLALSALAFLAALCAQPATSNQESAWTPASLSRLPWLKLGGEVRARLEAPTAQNFLDGLDDTYDLTRLRLNVRITATPWLRFYGELQDIRAFGYDKPLPGSVNDRVDLRLAYVELGTPEGKGWNLRAGRQALKYGAGRLIWDPDWGSFGQTFDGVRLSLAGKLGRLDAFASSVLIPTDRAFDRPDTSNMFYGLYGSLDTFGNTFRIEPYLLLKSNARVRNELGRLAPLDVYTTGFRVYGTAFQSLRWESEMAFQTGRFAALPVHAFGGVWSVSLPTGVSPWRPRLTASYTYGTGDPNPKDGHKQTFDTLYPSVHLRNGATDRLGWANIHDLLGQAEWKLGRKARFSAGAHDFHLATLQDALYSRSGAVIVRNPLAASRHVGYECFGLLDWQIQTTWTAGLGYAHLFAGRFLQASHRSGATQPFVYLTYRF